jgi:F0F1-type ATP synthase alpha subunit
VERGRILRELLRQPRFTVRTVADQVFALSAVAEGWLDALAPADARRALWSAAERLPAELADVVGALAAEKEPPGDWQQRMRGLLQRVVAEERG